MKINSWHQAQKKERQSWLETDMTYKYLMDSWESRKANFGYIFKDKDLTKSVLDVGSGPVPVLHIFPKFKKMVAVDPLEAEYRTKYKRLPHIKYHAAKAEKLPFKDNSFDYASCINALDHTLDYRLVLKEVFRCLKKGGIFYLEYENTSPLSIILAKLGYKKPLYDYHPLLLENHEVKKLIEKNGLEIIKMEVKPQFSFSKVMAIFSILLGLRKRSTYEQRTSVTDYGMSRALAHYLIIFAERLLFFIWPFDYGYFTKLLLRKKLK